MREPIDHETCSSLLGELAAGSLDATRTALVRDHLSSCDRCRSELVAVEALRVGRAARLSDDERRTLHEGILRARPSTTPAVRSPARRSWGERLVPALAAAAVIAVIAVGAANLVNSGGTGGQSSDAASGAAEALPANGASPRFLGDVGDVGAGGLARLAERPGKHATAYASGDEQESDQGLAPLAGAAPRRSAVRSARALVLCRLADASCSPPSRPREPSRARPPSSSASASVDLAASPCGHGSEAGATCRCASKPVRRLPERGGRLQQGNLGGHKAVR